MTLHDHVHSGSKLGAKIAKKLETWSKGRISATRILFVGNELKDVRGKALEQIKKSREEREARNAARGKGTPEREESAGSEPEEPPPTEES